MSHIASLALWKDGWKTNEAELTASSFVENILPSLYEFMLFSIIYLLVGP